LKYAKPSQLGESKNYECKNNSEPVNIIIFNNTDTLCPQNISIDVEIKKVSNLLSETVIDNTLIDENVVTNDIPIFRKEKQSINSCDAVKQDSIIKPNKELQILPAVKFKTHIQVNNSSLKNTLLKDEKASVQKKTVKFNFNAIPDESSDDEKVEVHHEGVLYKISRGKKLKKRYYKLVHKDLYCYRNKTDSNHKGLHNLSGVFIQEAQPLEFNEYFFYSFNLIFNNKCRTYYSDNEVEYKGWITSIKKATEYYDLNDAYEVKETLGNGKFGIVMLGIHKESDRKVAIKIMYKGNMNVTDLELVKTEIEILKVCQQPSIIRIYDVYENAEYIYISKFMNFNF
jgi:hypothetical protein